jgi:hypothetical protein
MRPVEPGVGYTVNRIGGRASLVIDLDGVGATAAPHPYQVFLKKDGSTWKARVYPGSINGQTSSMGGSPLDASPAPLKTISASGYLYLEVTHTDGQDFPVSSTVEFDTTVPSNTNTKAYIGLAYIDYTGSKATKQSQLVETSIWGERLKCGSSDAEYFFSRA